MLYHAFPDLQWLKRQAENNFGGRKWPNVVLNVKSGSVFRDNIPGPLSLFSNFSGKSLVSVDGRTSVVSNDYFFITNNTQRYTLEIQSAETFNIHFGEKWMSNLVEDENIEFYNKLYPRDQVVTYIQSQLKLSDKTTLEREELLTESLVHLLRVNRNEKIKTDLLGAAKLSTREDILRRLHLATDYIYSFYGDDISLDELAQISMLSKFHFIRSFKKAFGIAPHKFLNRVRIEKAKSMLKTDIPVVQIGREIGIKDLTSFSRLFKKEVGVYPTEFRN